MGTICDVLAKGGRIFTFYEAHHYEMKFNARILAELGVGEASVSITNAIDKAIRYVHDKDLQTTHLQKMQGLHFGGIRQSAKKINSMLI